MRHRVLIVDDEPAVLAVLKRFLSSDALEVLTASSGAEALEVLAETPVHVVVSDQNMSGMKGIDLLTKVRELHSDTARIVITGVATVEDVIAAINGGEVYRFLLKPCHPAELNRMVREALDHRELVAQGRRMLSALRAQRLALAEAEARQPGITRVAQLAQVAQVVEDAEDDAFTIEDEPTDISTFLAAVNVELAHSGAGTGGRRQVLTESIWSRDHSVAIRVPSTMKASRP